MALNLDVKKVAHWVANLVEKKAETMVVKMVVRKVDG